MDLIWLGCDLVTGKIIEELPDLTPNGQISSVLATVTSANFSLPIPLGQPGKAPLDWQSATAEGITMVVCVLSGAPVWAGVVLVNDTGTKPTAEIACMSLEGYLDRRYVGDHTWTGVDEASVIAAGLIADANVEGIGFVVDAPATGTLRDRAYKDQDDKTVYATLRELMGVIDGPEWAVVLGWTDATQTAVKKTIQVRKRIGMAGPPTAIFTSVGAPSADYSVRRDYSSGKGANHIVAVSSGQGDSRPQSAPARNIQPGWPRYELRYTPSTSITDIGVLNAHAAQTLTTTVSGARTVTVSARADVHPILGRDWNVGDDIGYDLAGHGHPDGLVGTARAVGWQFDPRTGIVTPILLMPGEEP